MRDSVTIPKQSRDSHARARAAGSVTVTGGVFPRRGKPPAVTPASPRWSVTPAEMIKNVGRIAWAFMTNQLPSDSIKAAYDLVSGNAPANERDMDKLKVFGPLAGVTFSKGAPGGPAAGELFKAREDHDFAVQQAMPEIRDMIKRGDIAKATDAMSKLDIPPGLQRYYVETTLNPQKRLQGKAGRDFWQYATPEQQERMRRALSR